MVRLMVLANAFTKPAIERNAIDELILGVCGLACFAVLGLAFAVVVVLAERR